MYFVTINLQNVKAYLRRGTAREMLGYFKEATEGESGIKLRACPLSNHEA